MNLRNLMMSAVLAGILGSSTLYMGCRISSSDSVTRNVDINVAGLYRNNGNPVISQQTGSTVTQLNVIQDGDRLQAIDNNGLIFRGRIGSVQNGSATFNLDGMTTTGQEGVISGTISVEGNTATMRGTWAEPTLFGNVLATAEVVPRPEPTPDDDDNDDNDDNDDENGNNAGNNNGTGGVTIGVGTG